MPTGSVIEVCIVLAVFGPLLPNKTSSQKSVLVATLLLDAVVVT